MRCNTCGGTLYRDWEDIRCLACGRSLTPPRTATPVERRLTGPKHQLTPELVQSMKLDLAADGPRMALYRRIAPRYATSVATVRKIANNHS